MKTTRTLRRFRLSFFMIMPLAMLLKGVGCSTALDSEAYLRLSIASPGGALKLVKGPGLSDAFPTDSDRGALFVHLEPREPLGIERVEAVVSEMEDAGRGFAAGYRAYHAGNDVERALPHGVTRTQVPPVPEGVSHPPIWTSAFLVGWSLARRETAREDSGRS